MEQGEHKQPRSEPAQQTRDVDWSECEHSQGWGVPVRLTRGVLAGNARRGGLPHHASALRMHSMSLGVDVHNRNSFAAVLDLWVTEGTLAAARVVLLRLRAPLGRSE